MDSKIVSADEVYHCEGFESDEKMKKWTYRKLKGVTYVNDTEFGGDNSSSSDASAKPAKKNTEVKNPPVELKPIPRPSRPAPKQSLESNGPLRPLRNSEQRAISLEQPEKR